MTAIPFSITDSLADVDWGEVLADLIIDDFSNGRTAAALRRSFEQSQHAAIAWSDGRVIGTARLLSDGVGNAYLVDVWTQSAFRRRGVGAAMVHLLADAVPGQHIGLQTDDAEFYAALGFVDQPRFMSKVIGTWLDNDANGDRP